MWSLKLRIVLIFISLCILQSCGFQPLYGTHSASTTSHGLLSSVTVSPIKGRIGQIFKTTLEDTLNPSHTVAEQKYRLDVTLNTTQSSLAIQRDQTISRYQIIVTANYTLTDIATNTTVRKGKLERESGYDRITSPYATFVSENAATNNALKALAQDLSFLTTSSVIGYDAKKTGKP